MKRIGNCGSDEHHCMPFSVFFPMLIIALILAIALGVHLLGQYRKRHRPTKDNDIQNQIGNEHVEYSVHNRNIELKDLQQAPKPRMSKDLWAKRGFNFSEAGPSTKRVPSTVREETEGEMDIGDTRPMGVSFGLPDQDRAISPKAAVSLAALRECGALSFGPPASSGPPAAGSLFGSPAAGSSIFGHPASSGPPATNSIFGPPASSPIASPRPSFTAPRNPYSPELRAERPVLRVLTQPAHFATAEDVSEYPMVASPTAQSTENVGSSTEINEDFDEVPLSPPRKSMQDDVEGTPRASFESGEMPASWGRAM